jgi:SpoIID/LytB domain protein
MRRWRIVASAVVAIGVLGGQHAVAGPAVPAAEGVAVVRLDGRGHGHGVGLSQWGAERMAREGLTADEILATFYPGTEAGTAGGDVRVAVHHAPGRTVTWRFPQGGEVRSAPGGEQAPGFPVSVPPGGQVRVTLGDGYVVEPLAVAASPGTATAYRSGDHPQQSDCGLLGIVCPEPDEPPPTTSPPTTQPPPSTTQPPPPTTQPPSQPPPDPPPPGGDPSPAEPAPAPEQPGPDAPPPAHRAPGPVWAVPAGGGATTVMERGRTYRGLLQAVAGGSGLRVVNQVDVEVYLAGMAEVPGSWPPAAVQAQTVAARTYALRAMRTSGEICDTERCQVYVGVDREHPGQLAAVDATRGQVLTYGGELATAVYSADGGGVSATTHEGFGTPDGLYPYLSSVRYGERPDGAGAWGAEVALGDVASRFRYPGQLADVRISEKGPSGRALTITLEGDAGSLEVEGRRFASALGLRSTLFQAELGVAGEAPPAPEASELQDLPEMAAASATDPSAAARAAERVAGAEAHLAAAQASHQPAEVAAASVRGAARIATLAIGLVTAAAIALGDPRRLAPHLVSAPHAPWRGGPGRWRATLPRWATRTPAAPPG